MHVGNDTFAVLRAGTERGWGVAVVCGAGINCVGVAPDGRHARFPALGAITGDWGGGYDLGLAAVSAAARSEDGRGPRTSLERAVPATSASPRRASWPKRSTRARIAQRRVIELAPSSSRRPRTTRSPRGSCDQLADEVVALARVALSRLELDARAGRGAARRRRPAGRATDDLLEAIDAGLHEVAPNVAVRAHRLAADRRARRCSALDALGADADAQDRLRRELGAAVAGLEGVATVG